MVWRPHPPSFTVLRHALAVIRSQAMQDEVFSRDRCRSALVWFADLGPAKKIDTQ